MNVPLVVIIILSVVTDFTIVAGSTVLGSMLATGGSALPSKGVWILAAVSGVVAAAKELRSQLHIQAPPEQPGAPTKP